MSNYLEIYKDGIFEEDKCDPIVVKATKEGRINIPKTLVDEVDITGGSIDFMIKGKAVYGTPNADGRVRLSLAEIGITTSDEVTLSLSSDNRSIAISGE